MSRPYFTDAEWEEIKKTNSRQCNNDIKRPFLDKQAIINAAIEMMKDRYKTNQQATADHTAKMFNHSRTQHLAWGGNPATLEIVLPKDYIVIDDYPIHPGYRHDKDGYVWMYNGNGWVKQEKIKMTRKEAIEKAFTVTSGINSNDIVNVLEALGLIKFDEEKSVVDEAKIYVRNYTLYDRQELAGVIDMLIRHIELK